MPKVSITGWRGGLLKTSLIQVLREHLQLGVREAEECAERVLDGRVMPFSVENLDGAQALAKALEEVGAIAEVEAGETESAVSPRREA